MRLYGASRVQWVAIAIAVGALLAWLQSGSARAGHTQTHSPTTLEGLLTRQPMKGEDGSVFPWTRAVTVYPPTKAGFTVTAAEGDLTITKSAVTFEVLTAAPDRKGWTYRQGTTLVSVPFRGRGGQQYETVTDYLAALADNREWLSYSYAWWADPKYAYPIWIGGCIFVIGICWPLALSLLVRAGYGPSPEEMAAERQERSGWLKAWFTPASSPSTAAKQTSSQALTEEDLARIAKMEDDLRGFAVTGEPGDAARLAADAEPTIRQLNAAPLDDAPVIPQREAQDYDGEFYPTVAHAKKKQEPQR